MGTHQIDLSESYLMSTNMTGFICLKKKMHSCAMDESSLSIGRFKVDTIELYSRKSDWGEPTLYGCSSQTSEGVSIIGSTN